MADCPTQQILFIMLTIRVPRILILIGVALVRDIKENQLLSGASDVPM